jgi:hypothetical protein
LQDQYLSGQGVPARVAFSWLLLRRGKAAGPLLISFRSGRFPGHNAQCFPPRAERTCELDGVRALPKIVMRGPQKPT